MSDKPYRDPRHRGNSKLYHTGRDCIEPGCRRPAGTAWSDLWCFECNVRRMDRIDRQLRDIMGRFERRTE